MKKLLSSAVLLALLLALCGCSSLHTTITEQKPDGSVETTTVRVRTFMDGRSQLSKFHTTSTDKTKAVSIGGLAQESTSEALRALVEGIVAGAVKGAK